MDNLPLWFTACIAGTVFSTVIIPASMHVGFGAVVLNLVALACFVVPMVAAWRAGEVGRESDPTVFRP